MTTKLLWYENSEHYKNKSGRRYLMLVIGYIRTRVFVSIPMNVIQSDSDIPNNNKNKNKNKNKNNNNNNSDHDDNTDEDDYSDNDDGNGNGNNNNDTRVRIPSAVFELLFHFQPKQYYSRLSAKYCTTNNITLSKNRLTVNKNTSGMIGVVRCDDALHDGSVNTWYVRYNKDAQEINEANSIGLISDLAPDAYFFPVKTRNRNDPWTPWHPWYQRIVYGENPKRRKMVYLGLGLDRSTNDWTFETMKFKDYYHSDWYQPPFTKGQTMKIVCDLRENRQCISFYYLPNDQKRIGDNTKKNIDYTFKLPTDRKYTWYPCLAPWCASFTLGFNAKQPKALFL